MYWRKPLDQNQIKVPYGVIHIIEERCKGCGFCVEFCPQEILIMSDHTNAKGYHPPVLKDGAHCVSCGLCALLCPDFAIYIEDKGERTPEKIESKRKKRGK